MPENITTTTSAANRKPLPERSAEARTLGRVGENLTLCAYVDRGCRPVCVNWRAGDRGELDVVVFDAAADALYVCEVKTRTGSAEQLPPEYSPSFAVRRDKIMRIKYSTRLFLAKFPEYAEKNVRFDVAEVYNRNGAYSVSIIENAF